MMMYELHVPLVMLSNRALQRGPSSGEDPNVIKQNLKVKFLEKIYHSIENKVIYLCSEYI